MEAEVEVCRGRERVQVPLTIVTAVISPYAKAVSLCLINRVVNCDQMTTWKERIGGEIERGLALWTSLLIHPS